MARLFVPLILVGGAVGLFMLYTNPAYQNIQSLTAQSQSYDAALTKAQELHTLRDQLLSKRNSFSNDDLNRLQQILPDNVDNIRLIIDINNIAAKHNLSLNNVDLGDLTGNSKGTAAAASSGIQTASSPIGSVDIGFSVSTSNYDDFLAFLQDLEHSLRLVDVEKIAFQTGANSLITYNLTVRTYWLH